MSETAPVREAPLPRWVPAALSFVAGYVDIFTFLALFGLFVAQVTGTFVTAGAELATHDLRIGGKVVAVAGFLLATALTAAFIAVARERGHATLPWMLALETVLLALFTVMLFSVAPATRPGDWRTILAGLFGAMAMGTQSVIVRLLMRGVPQTNVMTGNMTQLGIETTNLILAWRRRALNPRDPAILADFAAVRVRLTTVLAIALGFLFGAGAGAASYAQAGLSAAPLAVVIIAALTLWAAAQQMRAQL
jgi:uncharacterized membrane protein YoaK (UPF0700 family)